MSFRYKVLFRNTKHVKSVNMSSYLFKDVYTKMTIMSNHLKLDTGIIMFLPISCSDNLPYTGTQAHQHTHTHTETSEIPLQHSFASLTQGQIHYECEWHVSLNSSLFSPFPADREERVGSKPPRLKALTDSMCASNKPTAITVIITDLHCSH